MWTDRCCSELRFNVRNDAGKCERGEGSRQVEEAARKGDLLRILTGRSHRRLWAATRQREASLRGDPVGQLSSSGLHRSRQRWKRWTKTTILHFNFDREFRFIFLIPPSYDEIERKMFSLSLYFHIWLCYHTRMKQITEDSISSSRSPPPSSLFRTIQKNLSFATSQHKTSLFLLSVSHSHSRILICLYTQS